ncbi:rRNA maturation RNase YbeY [Collinsella sp. zg1085]|uniref:rRNA maturation RNase YbeY n=1 Tax=Collinsella sp. zg1085 TaxID=2844380 RepID=UPI001C0D9A8F|nr:rRNA maturation RNase YbeY [Collinsella sp. zg1085]QWT16982.1 rRNA maturation RNase YbeY [Collinsella sp. zg1085]
MNTQALEIDVIIEDGQVCPLEHEELRIAGELCLQELAIERACCLSVSVVGATTIQALNLEWRQIDAPTDVLSFACDSPFDEDIPCNEVLELGDIVLAPEIIAAQAPQFDTSFEDEFRLMFVHGLLHILGFDHLNESDACIMEAHELAVLQSLARWRGDDPSSVLIGPTTHHEDEYLQLKRLREQL